MEQQPIDVLISFGFIAVAGLIHMTFGVGWSQFYMAFGVGWFQFSIEFLLVSIAALAVWLPNLFAISKMMEE